MNTLRNRLTHTTFILLLATGSAFAADANGPFTAMPDGTKDLSVDEVVHWTNFRSYYQARSGRANVEMTIVDGRGQKRTRQFTILRRDAQGDPNSAVARITVRHKGADPKDIEQTITKKLEEALKTVDGVESINSESQQDQAEIRVVGQAKTKPADLLAGVKQAVDSAGKDLPEKASEPTIELFRPDHVSTGEQKYYVYFRKPADVAKTVFLVWKHIGKNDDRWMYFPDLDLVKRISAADKRTSFVGSHFLYEDVSGRSIDLDKHELIDTNKTYFVLKNTPKNPKDVEFGHYVMYVHRKTFLVVQTTYYDKQGKAYRKYSAQAVKTIEGYPTVVKSRMKDLKTGGYTDLGYSDVDYNVALPDDIFDKRYLRRPPRKYLGE